MSDDYNHWYGLPHFWRASGQRFVPMAAANPLLSGNYSRKQWRLPEYAAEGAIPQAPDAAPQPLAPEPPVDGVGPQAPDAALQPPGAGLPALNNGPQAGNDGQQAADAAQQAVGAAQQPAGAAQQPAGAAQQPVGVAPQLVHAAPQLAGAAPQFAGAAAQLAPTPYIYGDLLDYAIPEGYHPAHAPLLLHASPEVQAVLMQLLHENHRLKEELKDLRKEKGKGKGGKGYGYWTDYHGGYGRGYRGRRGWY